VTHTLPEGWSDFAVAAAGSTAALAGLLVVAMSVNVAEIMGSRVTVAGARTTIASLVLAIAASLLILPAGQTRGGLGIPVLVLAVAASFVQVAAIRTQGHAETEGMTTGVRAVSIGLAAAEHVPFLVGGVLLVAGADAGLWWLVVGIVAVVVSSMVNAWVLLIEVRR
jgi:modulator of FtsH protease